MIDNPYGFDNTIHNNVPGMFKDELGGKLIFEVIALGSKLYSIKKEEFNNDTNEIEIVDDK